MARTTLATESIHPAAQTQIGIPAYAATLQEVQASIQQNAVVMVSMAQNPYPKKARKLLQSAGIEFTELSYGSYFSCWRQRLAIKMWSGWPTLPMMFVGGQLIGGFQELQQLHDNGELQSLIAAAKAR